MLFFVCISHNAPANRKKREIYECLAPKNSASIDKYLMPLPIKREIEVGARISYTLDASARHFCGDLNKEAFVGHAQPISMSGCTTMSNVNDNNIILPIIIIKSM